ncbi:hypothetical protein AD998_04340 [bacterium 336/3]|nr:hypothetical protein AD998_04340 [bacterium 336/3]
MNGEKIGELKNGEEKYIEIDNFFDKEIEVKIAWCGSGKRKISKQHLIITGNIFFNQRMPIMVILFWMTGLLININKEISIWGTGLVCFLLLSTLTIFRNKWIRIQELNTT